MLRWANSGVGRLHRPAMQLAGLCERFASSSASASSGSGIRTRFAPSPTGELHLGGLRTALFAYLWARRTGGSFVLRIEDTDRKRRVDGAVENIMRDLEWCGISPDEFPGLQQASSISNDLSTLAVPATELIKGLPGWAQDSLLDDHMRESRFDSLGPYMQSERKELGLYHAAAAAMLEAGTAYRCFCSSDRLDALRAQQTKRGQPVMYDRACSSVSLEESDRRAASGEPFTVRLRVPVAASHMHAQEERWEAARALSGAAYHDQERVDIEAASHLFFEEHGDPRGLLSGSPLTQELLSGSAEPSARVAVSGASGHGVAGTVVRDVVLGNVPFSHSAVDDCVLLKSDGWPTYHLASVVDDITMRITDVVRGQEWLTSAPKHVLIYRGLGVSDAAIPRFTHLPLLLGPDRKKLSKRAGDASVGDFRERYGVLPGALLNFVAFLGWTPATSSAKSDSAMRDAAERSEADVMSLTELAEQFTLSDVHRSNAVVDRKRLEWMQGRHAHRALQKMASHHQSHLVGFSNGASAENVIETPATAPKPAAGVDADASGLSETVAVMEAVISELDALLGLRSHTSADGSRSDVMQPGWIERSKSLNLPQTLTAGLTGTALPDGVESGSKLLMQPLDGSIHFRCIETPDSATFRKLQPLKGVDDDHHDSSSDRNAIGSSSADSLPVPTVARIFDARYMLLCLLLQHERAELPAELAPLLLPLLVPPLPSDAASLTAEQRAAFDKVWHADAGALLKQLQTAWLKLANPPETETGGDAIGASAFQLADSLRCVLETDAVLTGVNQSAAGAMQQVKAVMKAYGKACAADTSSNAVNSGGDDGTGGSAAGGSAAGGSTAGGSAAGGSASGGSASGGSASARKSKRKKMPASRLMLPLRWALTGQHVGPPLGDLIAVLGQDVCMARLEAAIALSEHIGAKA